MDGGTLRFGLALGLEQRVVDATNVAHQLMVLPRAGLATEILAQSLLTDGEADSQKLGNRLGDRERRDGDRAGRRVQADVATWNRARRGKRAQLAGPDGEIQRPQELRAEQVRVEAGERRRCCAWGRAPTAA